MAITELPEKMHREIQHFIKTHDVSDKATFDTRIDEKVDWERTNIGRDLFLWYSMCKFPMPLSDEEDLNGYANHLINKPPFMIPGGDILRYVDYHPGCEPAWHRTVTIE